MRREAEKRDKEKQAHAGGRHPIPKTVLASTVRAQEAPLSQQASPPAVETIHAPPPDRLSFEKFSSGQDAQTEFALAIAGTSKRTLVIAVVVLVVFVGAALLIWSLTGKTTSQDATETAQTSNTPTRTNQAGIEFVLISPGSFMMRSEKGDADEKPVHQVTINYSFYMGKNEVT